MAGRRRLHLADQRKYIELKAIVNELENCLDMADSMFKFSKEEKGE